MPDYANDILLRDNNDIVYIHVARRVADLSHASELKFSLLEKFNTI